VNVCVLVVEIYFSQIKIKFVALTFGLSLMLLFNLKKKKPLH